MPFGLQFPTCHCSLPLHFIHADPHWTAIFLACTGKREGGEQFLDFFYIYFIAAKCPLLALPLPLPLPDMPVTPKYPVPYFSVWLSTLLISCSCPIIPKNNILLIHIQMYAAHIVLFLPFTSSCRFGVIFSVVSFCHQREVGGRSSSTHAQGWLAMAREGVQRWRLWHP